MTTIASILIGTLPSYSLCVSNEARRLEALVQEQRSPRGSVLLGEPFRRLEEACTEARSVGWDGQGALPVSEETYRRARTFVEALATDVPAPDVWVDADGDLIIEWSTAPRCVFAVVVREGGFLDYSGIFGHETAYGTEVFIDQVPEALGRSLERYLVSSSRARTEAAHD